MYRPLLKKTLLLGAVASGCFISHRYFQPVAFCAADTAAELPPDVAPSPDNKPPPPSSKTVPAPGKLPKLDKDRLIAQFEQFASVEENGERLMTQEDFIKALGVPNTHVLAFFGLADSDQSGRISLSEWVTFATLMRTQDAHLRIAFSLFDKDADQRITLDEFEQVVRQAWKQHGFSEPIRLKLLPGSAFALRWFGPEGDRRSLSIDDFGQMLAELQTVYLETSWRQLDLANKGHVSGADLVKLLAKDAPPHITKVSKQGLAALAKKRGFDRVSFGEFTIMRGLLSDVDRLEAELRRKGAKPLDEAVFASAAERVLRRRLSTAERDFAFSVIVGGGRTSSGPPPTASQFAETLRERHAPVQTMSYFQYVLMSGASSMVGATAVFPMDKIKTRIQASTANIGIMTTAKDIFRKEGFFRMYRGLQAQLVGITPEKALKLTANQYFVDLLTSQLNRPLTWQDHCAAGALTGMCQITLSTPLEQVKIKLQMQRSAAEIKTPVQVIRELGMRGLYRGFAATALRDIPFNIIFFGGGFYFKELFRDKKTGEISGAGHFAASFLSGLLAAGLDTPADCIKTRLQSGAHYKGIADAARQMWAQEGYQAFAKGLIPRMAIIAPQFGITMWALALLQEVMAPFLSVPLTQVEQELQAYRGVVSDVDAKLRLKYGL